MNTITIPMLCGMAVRGDIKRHILVYGRSKGLDIKVEEDKGFLESLYTFTIKGTDEQLSLIRKEFIRVNKLYGGED